MDLFYHFREKGENGTNDAFAVQSRVADFLPDWADFLVCDRDIFRLFRRTFLTVK
jgi:hypothetical protein